MKKITQIIIALSMGLVIIGCSGGTTPELDTTPPVITVTGGTAALTVGGTYTPPTVTANDDIDGDITIDIIVGGDTVIDDVAGTYVVTYNVMDSSANNAIQQTHTVTVNPVSISTLVIDQIPTQNVDDWGGGLATSLLTVTGSDINAGATFSIVSDPTDGGLTINSSTGELVWDKNVNGNQSYSITVKVVNSDGGTDTESFTLNVTDNG